MNILLKSALLLFAACGLTACGDKSNSAESSVDKSQCSKEAVIENIMSRRSIRQYSEDKVPQELLDTIFTCGINAPNGRNQQAYEVKVVSDSASAAYLYDNVKGLYKAPVYVFIANDVNYNMSLIDVGLLSENIGLSAWAFGIGSINLGMPLPFVKENEEIMGKLNFSEGYDLCLVLAMGYPAETPDAKPRVKEKVQYVELKD